jgi:sensor histidine kinase regulating citrate/malate metabolism
MVMNAVEALPLGGQAQIWHERHAGRTTFVVQNPGCLAPEVVDRIFQRSFSTKAERGRGLGTYTMKLLGESVLGGKVGFHSDWANGTRFFIELPGGA